VLTCFRARSEGKSQKIKGEKDHERHAEHGNLLKQAQQFQAKMAKLQEELGEKTVEASAGRNVTVVANGRQEVFLSKSIPK